MRNLQTKIIQAQQTLNRALDGVMAPQEILNELVEKEIIEPGATSKIGQLALQAQASLEDLLEEFTKLTGNAHAAIQTAAEEPVAQPAAPSESKAYTPSKKRNGNAFGPN